MKKIILILMTLLSCVFCFSMNAEPKDVNHSFSYFSDLEKDTRGQVDWFCIAVTTERPGELLKIIGDNINLIDSIAISGPINPDDFNTLWNSSFYGRLRGVNLINADIQEREIPPFAFYHPEIQDGESGGIWCTHLRSIDLPRDLIGIGECAFSYVIDLSGVNLPDSVRILGDFAFINCSLFGEQPFIIPEGVERIGKSCFGYNNFGSKYGNVILPSTIREIAERAFYRSSLSSINLPDGLETLGNEAFYECKLSEIDIPGSCKNLKGGAHFEKNNFLEEMRINEGIEYIPSRFAFECGLRRLNLPETLKYMEEQSFSKCTHIESMIIPEGCEVIDKESFKSDIRMKELTFPSTIDFLGFECCSNLRSLSKIICKAQDPPECEFDENDMGMTPFGRYEDSDGTPRDIPVYVPIGTSDYYRSAPGWDYFTNYIETDFYVGVDELYHEGHDKDIYYDLQGKKVIHPQKGSLYIKDRKVIKY